MDSMSPVEIARMHGHKDILALLEAPRRDKLMSTPVTAPVLAAPSSSRFKPKPVLGSYFWVDM